MQGRYQVMVLLIQIFVIWYCFEIRISIFEFLVRNLGLLP